MKLVKLILAQQDQILHVQFVMPAIILVKVVDRMDQIVIFFFF